MADRPRWVFDRGLLWAIELNTPPPRIEPRIPAQIRELDAAAIPALVAPGSAGADILRQRFSTGRRCFGVAVENEIAAYGWVSQHAEYIGEQEREFKLQNDEAYIWDCATLPSYRGQHLYSALLSEINNALYTDKLRRVWIGAQQKNHASLRGFSNAGFRPIVLITYARLFHVHAVWFQAQRNAPREQIRAVERAWTDDDQFVWGRLAWSWRTNRYGERSQAST